MLFNHLRISVKKNLQSVALLLIAIVIAATSSTSVFAADTQFYETNDILFYNKNDTVCTTQPGAIGASVTGSDIAEKVFNFLTSTSFKGLGNKPMNAIQAAGALGNFQRESMMDPTAVQAGGGGRGLAQWDSARRDQLFAYADQQGKSWTDLTVQLNFMKTELDGWEGTNLNNGGFMTAASPQEAAVIFDDRYERSGIPAIEERKAHASVFYLRFAATATTTTNTAAASSDCRAAGTGPVGNMQGDEFITYAQCSTSTLGGPWGDKVDTNGQTMCMVGCGPTSLAMVVANLKGNGVTPEDTRVHYNENNLWASFGSGPVEMRQAAEHFGLRHEAIHPRDLDAYKKVFAAGGLIVIGGQGSKPFYPGFGHYVVVRGITADGKFKVSDPGRGIVENYDITEFMSNTNGREGNSTAFYAS